MVALRAAVRVAELTAHFDVDVATVRRDLQALGEQGKIQRVHGGAAAVEGAAPERGRESSGTQEARIGQAAAAMVTDGETVSTRPGRLTLEVARRLAARSNLTVVTNGLEVAQWFPQTRRTP
jgi:DeoR/GlpR family transcriptional regulator of sugar metabolism